MEGLEMEVEGHHYLASFLTSLAVIICSEIGDKTFLIAALLSMRHDWRIVWLGSSMALWLMTVLSACVGVALTSYFMISQRVTNFTASLLLVLFGLKMLYDASSSDHGNDELKEVEKELATATPSPNQATKSKSKIVKDLLGRVVNPIFLQAFALTFLGEWGDRSQVATIALAVSREALGVVVGALVGHGACTGLACIGGRLLASSISEKTVTLIGGSLYLTFGLYGLVT